MSANKTLIISASACLLALGAAWYIYKGKSSSSEESSTLLKLRSIREAIVVEQLTSLASEFRQLRLVERDDFVLF